MASGGLVVEGGEAGEEFRDVGILACSSGDAPGAEEQAGMPVSRADRSAHPYVSKSAASASRWRLAAAILVASHSSRSGSMMVVCDRRSPKRCLVASLYERRCHWKRAKALLHSPDGH